MGIRLSWSFLGVLSALVFCLSFLVPNFLASPDSGSGNQSDLLALLQFKSKITHDPLGALDSWNRSIHFCQWHGVTCSRSHQQRVTILDLESLKLAGSIAPHIGNLSFLRVLNLENNSFNHEIPAEIGRLRRLQILALANNSIGGEIPANISNCSNLNGIYLSRNQLEGKIPSEFSSLSKIQDLQLESNYLTGSIPSSLGNLSSIDTISLNYNNLDGSLPDTFGRLENLEFLSLVANSLCGFVPSSIFNISSIVTFDVGVNKIQGDIPHDFGITLPNLQHFGIGFNQITGAIPSSISNASKLEIFQVPKNKLSGKVPSLQKLQMLSRFVVTSNSLGSGRHNDLNFLCSLTNATSLKSLFLNDNNFGGLLPGCFSNLSTNLEKLLLDSNKIFGRIPAGIGNFVNLQRLEMWNNQLSGTIPPTIGELQNLVILSLNGNRLSGNIPQSFGHLKKLLSLNLSDNLLQGRIPSSLGQCKSLLAIDLSNNNLGGTIPPQFFRLASLSIVLDLSRNHFIGSIPSEVEKLENLEILDVSRNKFEGKIPSTLGSCTRLEKLEMQGNFFQGHIPASLSSLRGLTFLDMSQNKLSDNIPEFLAGLRLMQNLNLSYNDLEGAVPKKGVFKNASATSILGNVKLCGGIPELQLPTCGPKNYKQRRLGLGLKLVIAITSSLVGLTLMLSLIFLCWVKKIKDKPNPRSSINSLLNLSYQNLYNDTDGFSPASLIGVGSFGSVYKGVLNECRTTVAVKVFNLLNHRASRSFITECNALKNIRHRNLVKVLTACSGVDYQGSEFKALVYEFMQNGNLEEWLHPVTREEETDEAPRSLNLLQRLNIAIDVAHALNYLHHDCQPPMAHCDLKPGNVLLDEEMTAHVGDFGLVRFIPLPDLQTSSLSVKGSVGYIAPEYGLGREVSTSGDVYSYGILLLELVIKKKPSDIMFEGGMNLHNFARGALPDHVIDIVDSTLLNDDEDLAVTGNERQRQARINSIIKCLISMVRIGVACSMESPQHRMRMNNVVQELQSVKSNLLRPKTVPNFKEGNSTVNQILHKVEKSQFGS